MKYVLKRLALGVLILWASASFVFFLMRLLPSDPVEIILGENARPAQIEELKRELGLDKPLWVQYINFLSGLTRADLGRSLISNERVTDLILSHLPYTGTLALFAIILTVLLSFPLAILATIKEKADLPVFIVSTAGLAIPNFWLGPLLILFLSVKLRIFPVSGAETPAHYILPAITLATALSAYLVKIIRKSIKEESNKPYILALSSRGLSRNRIFLYHILPNAMIPIITIVGLETGALLTGTIITERVFSIPGIGTLLIKAIGERDYPLVQGLVLFIAAVYVLINLLVDLSYPLIDPRIKLGGDLEKR